MAHITTEKELRQVYKTPKGRSLAKQMSKLEKHSKRFIKLSPFLVLSSTGPDGLGDTTPRGGEPGFVHVLDDNTIAVPDRPGNNRLDTLTNLLTHPGVGLIFFIPGVNETLRINGKAEIHTDLGLLTRFEMRGKLPASVLVVRINEVYLHCAKALMRSEFWSPDAQADKRPIPTIAQMINDQSGVDMELETDEDMRVRYAQQLY